MSYEGEVLSRTEGTEDWFCRLRVPDAPVVGPLLAERLTARGITASVGIRDHERLIVRVRGAWSSTRRLTRRHTIFKTWIEPTLESYSEINGALLRKVGEAIAEATGSPRPEEFLDGVPELDNWRVNDVAG